MYSLVGQKRRFSEKGLVISLAAFFFLLPIVLYMPQILNGESIISGDGLLVLFSGDALRESLLEGEIPLWSPAIAFGEPFAELNNHCYSPICPFCCDCRSIWGCTMPLRRSRLFCCCANWDAEKASAFQLA